jgi:hypothetical protein
VRFNIEHDMTNPLPDVARRLQQAAKERRFALELSKHSTPAPQRRGVIRREELICANARK